MERRLHPRQPVDIIMLCRIPATPYRVRVVDATRSGCRLSLRQITLSRGQSVILEIDADTRISGTVVWRTAIEAGVQFDTPLRTPVARLLGIACSAQDIEDERIATSGAEDDSRADKRSAA